MNVSRVPDAIAPTDRADESADRKARPFTVRRMLLVVTLFALAFGCVTRFGTGSAAVFFVGTVPSATFVGAALGVPFDRQWLGAGLGLATGLAFFVYALLT